MLDSPDAWALMIQWADDVINFPTHTQTMEDKFGNRYMYSEWQDLISQVFVLLEEDGHSAAAAVKAAMDAHGIVHSGVNSSPEPATLQALQSDAPNRRVKRKASRDGRSTRGGGQALRQRPNK